mmetsp:Transcript_5160/g.7264  ORF Transcript_5160/g.7264 Transcript_5160/m.7264 type:complete len:96 (+) Transcript_5160:68-355(+)
MGILSFVFKATTLSVVIAGFRRVSGYSIQQKVDGLFSSPLIREFEISYFVVGESICDMLSSEPDPQTQKMKEEVINLSRPRTNTTFSTKPTTNKS